MTVSITSPPPGQVDARVSLTVRVNDDDGTNPTGVLTDVSSGQSWNGSVQQVMGQLNYYDITFNPGGMPPLVASRDLLSVTVRDTGTLEGCQQSYQQLRYSDEQYDRGTERQKHRARDDNCIKIHKEDRIDPTQKIFNIRVDLPGDREGCLFLCLLNESDLGEQHEHTADDQFFFPLVPPSPPTAQPITYTVSRVINFGNWEHICVVVTAPGCTPDTWRMKP